MPPTGAAVTLVRVMLRQRAVQWFLVGVAIFVVAVLQQHPDWFRGFFFAQTGVTAGLLIAINITAGRVLRPVEQHVGFVLWHILLVSAATVGLAVLGAESVAQRFHDPTLTWRAYLFAGSITVLNAALVVIFRVERRRLIAKHAAALASRA